MYTNRSIFQNEAVFLFFKPPTVEVILFLFLRTEPGYGFQPEGVSVAYLLTVKKPVLPALQSAQVCVPLPVKPVGLGSTEELALELVFVKSAGTEEDSSLLCSPKVGMAGVGVTVTVLTMTVVEVTV